MASADQPFLKSLSNSPGPINNAEDNRTLLDELVKKTEWRAIPVIALMAIDMDGDECIRLEGRVGRIIQKGAYSIEQILKEVRDVMVEDFAQFPRKADDTSI